MKSFMPNLPKLPGLPMMGGGSTLGIYFGPKMISIIETKNKKLLFYSQIPQTTVSAGELEEKVPMEAKTGEIAALIKDELIKNNCKAKEAVICLSGKDLIIRSFEMPILPREEMHSAVQFEVRKYLPFKIEELISDFQVAMDKMSGLNQVLFVGIKKDTFQRYLFMMQQIGIKVKAMEYSAFSLLRGLKLSGANDKGIIGVLGVDLKGEDEINFTVLENGFPLFSRDITLMEQPQEAVVSGAHEPAKIPESLKKEIRVSLDYYHRKFPTKNISNIFLLTGQEYRPDLESFIKEAGFNVSYAEVTKFIDSSVPYSLSFIKGFSVSLHKATKTSLKVDLSEEKAKEGMVVRGKPQEKESIQKEATALFQDLFVDIRVIMLALLIVSGGYGYGYYKSLPLRERFQKTVAIRPNISNVDLKAKQKDLDNKAAEYKNRIAVLDKLINNQFYLTEPLGALPKTMSNGMWLVNLSFKKDESGKANFNLEGKVYLDDGEKEFEAVNNFAESLKRDAGFSKYFKDAVITSLDRKQTSKGAVTSFTVACKNF